MRQMRRIFSKNSYNGYRIVTLSEEPNTGLLLGKPLPEKDEYGFLCDENDIPKCPNVHEVNVMGRPWASLSSCLPSARSVSGYIRRPKMIITAC